VTDQRPIVLRGRLILEAVPAGRPVTPDEVRAVQAQVKAAGNARRRMLFLAGWRVAGVVPGSAHRRRLPRWARG